VELWFAELMSHELRRPAHRSVTELGAAIRAWINAWNADPKPFVSAEAVGEILDVLTAYRRRINNSVR
jgi:hypothetical protein